jgi:hypothetical protein
MQRVVDEAPDFGFLMTKRSDTAGDTPGRPNSSSSRQQQHPDQAQQTGSEHLDTNSKHTAKPKRQEDLNSLPNRPAKKFEGSTDPTRRTASSNYKRSLQALSF